MVTVIETRSDYIPIYTARIQPLPVNQGLPALDVLAPHRLGHRAWQIKRPLRP